MEAKSKYKLLANFIDESKVVYDGSQHIVDLQKRIFGFPKDQVPPPPFPLSFLPQLTLFSFSQSLVAPNRTLVKEASLVMNQSMYWVFLFTDILVQTEQIERNIKKKKKEKEQPPTYNFVRLISLKDVELFDYPDTKGTFPFLLWFLQTDLLTYISSCPQCFFASW